MKKLIIKKNLQSYFYDELQKFNKKSSIPLSNQIILYSSEIMERFGESKKYFTISDNGKIEEKTLGMKLLESGSLPLRTQARELRDIGETSLFLCGYFSESLNNKLLGVRYYEDMGRIAYERLDYLTPKAYDVESFYNLFANAFKRVTLIIGLYSKKLKSEWGDDLSMIVHKKIEAC